MKNINMKQILIESAFGGEKGKWAEVTGDRWVCNSGTFISYYNTPFWQQKCALIGQYTLDILPCHNCIDIFILH